MKTQSASKKTGSKNSQVIVTGMGGVCSLGQNLVEIEEALYRKSASHFSRETLEKARGQGFFSAATSLDKTSDISLANQLAFRALEEAMSQAGYTRTSLSNSKLRVGVVLGTTVGCTIAHEEFSAQYYNETFPNPKPLDQYLLNNPAQRVRAELGVEGPALTISNACTSGTDALGIAKSWLDSGECDVVIAGGNDRVFFNVHWGFRSLMLCSKEPCRPFDRKRDGLFLGEGAGILILERQGRAPALGRILGFGSASDSFHPTSPDPEARGLGRAIQFALKQAELSESSIDFINAHGTGTPNNDLSEGRFYVRNFQRVPVVATKGFTGHTLGAAGALEAIFSLIALRRGELSTSLGFDEIDPAVELVPTRQAVTGDYKVALSTSIGFGGISSVVLLGGPS